MKQYLLPTVAFLLFLLLAWPLMRMVSTDPSSTASPLGIEPHATADRERALSLAALTSCPRPTRESAQILLEAVRHDPSEFVRQTALLSLQRTQPGDASIDEAIAEIYPAFSPELKITAFEVLGRRNSTQILPLADQALRNDPAPEVRRKAATAVQLLGDVQGLPLLEDAIARETDAQTLSTLQSARTVLLNQSGANVDLPARSRK